MSVWVVCPSARPPADVEVWAKAWRDRGYGVALWRDSANDVADLDTEEIFIMSPQVEGLYLGYAVAVNSLIAALMRSETEDPAEWFVIAGDDIFPDPNHTAEEIAAHCQGYFTKLHYGNEAHHAAEVGMLSTFGVIQPTGDRWGENPSAPNPAMRSAYIDRVAGSAWFGREYCRRINQGYGPMWPEYQHMFVDEEARGVAVKQGVYWERRDLTQLHQHWGRPKPGEAMGHQHNMPAFLKKANSEEHWKKYRNLFETRRNAGFPGSEPL